MKGRLPWSGKSSRKGKTVEYKSFYKTVSGNEGGKCHYPTRLDTYGCGCQHDCKYCYAKSLLQFRGLWNPKEPAVADIDKIRRKISRIEPGTVIRLGGMTDCFQAVEKQNRVTYETIKALNDRGVEYLIVTKSDLVAEDEYIAVMDKQLAHIQVSITCTDDDLYKDLEYENAPLPSRRIKAVEKLQAAGFDVSVRLSPFIPDFIDLDVLNGIKCDKILVEFLRVNSWIEKWLPLDYSFYTVKHGGYRHLPLWAKKMYLADVTGFKEVTVCEDEDRAYEYWRNNVNPQPDDCCNLRRQI